MRGDFSLSIVAAFIRRHWRTIAGAGLAGAGLYVAIEISDKQGRADLPYGYAVRMTCEDDPESHLWSGGCDRIAADIARTDPPSFGDLYRAFVIVHHSPIPSAATARQFANVPCVAGFNLDATLKGTRYILATEKFANVASSRNLPSHRLPLQLPGLRALKQPYLHKNRLFCWLIFVRRSGQRYCARSSAIVSTDDGAFVIVTSHAISTF